MDERIYRLVLSRPIPLKLVEALALAPDLTPYQTPTRVIKAKQWGMRSLEPDKLTPKLHRTLVLLTHGHTDREIAGRIFYSEESVKDQVKALCAVFSARNRTHLAALAVAQGYVRMELAA